MHCTVLGVRDIEYDNKQGRHITGTRLYVSFDERGTDGLACMDIFLNSEINPPLVGDQIIVHYNRYGRCQGYDLAG